MNSHKFLMFLIFFMMVGCSPTIVTPSIQVSRTETKDTVTTLPIPSVTVIPSVSLKSDFPEGCLSLTDTPINIDVFNNGLLVVFDGGNYSNYFLDPRLNQVLEIEEKKQISSFTSLPDFVSARISPNKKYLQTSFIDNDYGMIRTVNEVIKTYDTQGQEDWNRGRWLDNERMFFQYWEYPHGDTIVIYNPFTGEQKDIQLDLPNPYIVIDGQGRATWVRADIDPSLKRVLYNDKDERLILWDMDTQREIASLPSPTDLRQGRWSPDGKKFAIPSPSSNFASSELFMINVDGTVIKLTNFTQKFPFANVETHPSWSPDGHRIAFWLSISNVANTDSKTLRSWLAITDIITLDTQIYCLSPNEPPTGGGDIVWSPDSTQVIVNTDILSEQVKPVLVDLTHLTKSKLYTHGLWVLDWMAP
jgi:hypothetical protein